MDVLLALIISTNISVNSNINYVDDKIDYWQSPSETIKLKTGDCEDYAILKYFELLKKGIPDNDMRIAYTITESGGHMVLVVNKYVLDNMTDAIYMTDDIEIIYSFNSSAIYFNNREYKLKKLLPKWSAILIK
jgi:predicted transglutaminase-like cysteine proteinase